VPVHLAPSAAAYVVGVIFVATLVRSTIGFGEALIAVPLLALRIPVTVAAPLAVAVSILVAAAIVVQDWRRIHLRSATGLIASALCGLPIGLFLLAKAGDHTVKTLLGLVIVVFSAHSLTAGRKLHVNRDSPALLLACGLVSGILGGAYGMNGPPLAVYGSLRRWSPQHFRATLQGYFLPVSVAGLAGYAAMGLWSATVTKYFVLSLPGVVVAIVAGRALNERSRPAGFFQVVYVGLLMTGAILIAQAATG
jgi:uncharacterized membrane protein YfcA